MARRYGRAPRKTRDSAPDGINRRDNRKAADQGYGPAQLTLGGMYTRDPSVYSARLAGPRLRARSVRVFGPARPTARPNRPSRWIDRNTELEIDTTSAPVWQHLGTSKLFIETSATEARLQCPLSACRLNHSVLSVFVGRIGR